jgi:hypothetical protein
VIDDARVAGASLYVLSRGSSGATVSLTVYDLSGSSGWEPSLLQRDGSAAALRVVDEHVVLAYERPGGGTRVELLADGASGFASRGHVDLAAHLDRFERDVSERLDARDASRVRVLGCLSAACAAGDTLEIATIDASDPTRPRLVSTRDLPSPGRWLATRFGAGALYVSSRGWYGLGAPTTTIVRLSLDAPPAPDFVIRVPGAVVWNVASLGPRTVVVGTRGDLQTQTQRLVVGLLAPGERPAEPESAAYAVRGEGWASSPAESSSHALSACGGRVAVALRTWDEHSNPRSAVALLDSTANGLASAREVDVQGVVERLACVQGRLFALSDAGLWLVDSRPEPSRSTSPVVP